MYTQSTDISYCFLSAWKYPSLVVRTGKRKVHRLQSIYRVLSVAISVRIGLLREWSQQLCNANENARGGTFDISMKVSDIHTAFISIVIAGVYLERRIKQRISTRKNILVKILWQGILWKRGRKLRLLWNKRVTSLVTLMIHTAKCVLSSKVNDIKTHS
jgi:hypothetical protein